MIRKHTHDGDHHRAEPLKASKIDGTFGNEGVLLAQGDRAWAANASPPAVGPDGSLYIGYWAARRQADAPVRWAIFKSKPGGTPDTAFGPSGNGFGFGPATDPREPTRICVLPEGRILIALHLKPEGEDINLASLSTMSPDGAFDTAFGERGILVPKLGDGFAPTHGIDLFMRAADTIYVSGRAQNALQETRGFAIRLVRPDPDTPFQQDSSFNRDLGYMLMPFHVGDRPYVGERMFGRPIDDGRFLLAGSTQSRAEVRRYVAGDDGEMALDTTFGTDGTYVVPNDANPSDAADLLVGFVETNSGYVLAGRRNANLGFVVGITKDGRPDTTFARGGIATTPPWVGGCFYMDAAIDRAGSVVVTGERTESNKRAGFLAARYLVDGQLDHGFGDRGFAWDPLEYVIRSAGVAVQEGSHVVMAGLTGSADNYDLKVIFGRFRFPRAGFTEQPTPNEREPVDRWSPCAWLRTLWARWRRAKTG